MNEPNNYGLDLHCTMILEEYREQQAMFEKMREVVLNCLRKALDDNGILVTAVEGRVKTERSLAGKLELKGAKYATLSNLTDIVGVRVITFYTDEVDKIAALAGNIFDIDWENSVDKRKMYELNSFGYMSLHYICRIPKSVYCDPAFPELNEYRFELQMRTALQHVWANMYHDTGYKSGVEVPTEHLRNLNRLAGMLELADEQFSRIRTEINDYRRRVQALVADGNFDEVPLNGDTYRSYLSLEPFRKLAQQIAAINQAEVYHDSMALYLEVFVQMGFTTLGDVERMKNDYAGNAYKLAVHQIGGTDLDIIASSVAVQNLCVAYILGTGGGVAELKKLYTILGGTEQNNAQRAQRIWDQAHDINII